MTSAEITAANHAIAKQIGDTLNKHYPGHAWAVNASVEQGVVYIYNLNLSGQYGFTLLMSDLSSDPGMRLTIAAGGELLERYKLVRGAMREDEINDLSYDIRGNALQC